MAPCGSTLRSGGSRTYQKGRPFCIVTSRVARACERGELRDEARPLMRFKGKQQEVEAAEFTQIVACIDPHGKVAEIAGNPQAVARNRPQMRPAGDDRDGETGPSKSRGNKSADGTRADYRDSHWERLQATGRFELPNGAFAEPCLTTWLRRLTCDRFLPSG